MCHASTTSYMRTTLLMDVSALGDGQNEPKKYEREKNKKEKKRKGKRKNAVEEKGQISHTDATKLLFKYTRQESAYQATFLNNTDTHTQKKQQHPTDLKINLSHVLKTICLQARPGSTRSSKPGFTLLRGCANSCG